MGQNQNQEGQLLHIVIGITGQYEDTMMWNVAGYFDQQMAERHMALANMGAEAWLKKNQSHECPKAGDNPFDPGMQRMFGDDIYYRMRSVMVRDTLPGRPAGQGASATRNLTLKGDGAIEKVFWPDFREDAYLENGELNDNGGRFWGLAHWNTYLADVDEVIDCEKVEWFATEEARDAALAACL